MAKVNKMSEENSQKPISKVKPFICKICGKGFIRLSELSMHNVSNCCSKKGAYECEYCKKMFLYKCQLKIHSRAHSGERPYKCPHCDVAFKQLAHLAVHVRLHTGDKPIKCPLCDETFHRSSGMSTHLGMAHLGPNKCPICEEMLPKRYAPNDILKHFRMHKGKGRYRRNPGKMQNSALSLPSISMNTQAAGTPSLPTSSVNTQAGTSNARNETKSTCRKTKRSSQHDTDEDDGDSDYVPQAISMSSTPHPVRKCRKTQSYAEDGPVSSSNTRIEKTSRKTKQPFQHDIDSEYVSVPRQPITTPRQARKHGKAQDPVSEPTDVYNGYVQYYRVLPPLYPFCYYPPVLISQSTPTSVLISQSTPTPAVSSQSTPTPAVSSQSTPTPAISSQSTPTPAVSSQSTPTPAISSQSTPTPAISSQSTPTPAISSQSTPTPAISSQSTPTPVISSQSTPTPTISSQSTPTPAISGQFTPTPAVVSQSTPTPAVVSQSTPTNYAAPMFFPMMYPAYCFPQPPPTILPIMLPTVPSPSEPPIKLPRGRPRKDPLPSPSEPPIKRPRGRPRKDPLPSPSEPPIKRPRGRPRKNPLPSPNEPPIKWPRSRPRKDPLSLPAEMNEVSPISQTTPAVVSQTASPPAVISQVSPVSQATRRKIKQTNPAVNRATRGKIKQTSPAVVGQSAPAVISSVSLTVNDIMCLFTEPTSSAATATTLQSGSLRHLLRMLKDIVRIRDEHSYSKATIRKHTELLKLLKVSPEKERPTQSAINKYVPLPSGKHFVTAKARLQSPKAPGKKGPLPNGLTKARLQSPKAPGKGHRTPAQPAKSPIRKRTPIPRGVSQTKSRKKRHNQLCEKRYKCPFCTGRFRCTRYVVNHVQREHSGYRRCPRCGETLADEADLVKHLFTQHRETPPATQAASPEVAASFKGPVSLEGPLKKQLFCFGKPNTTKHKLSSMEEDVIHDQEEMNTQFGGDSKNYVCEWCGEGYTGYHVHFQTYRQHHYPL